MARTFSWLWDAIWKITTADILAHLLMSCTNIQRDIYQRQFKTPVLVPRDVWMKKNSVVKTLFITPFNLTSRLGWDENKHKKDIVIVFRFCPLSRRAYSISKTDPEGFWDEKNSRLRLKQTTSNAEGKVNGMLSVYHLMDEAGKERFMVRLQSNAMKSLDFHIQSVARAEIRVILRLDDEKNNVMCQVDNETFDIHSRFGEIWCGEFTTVVNLDLWSVTQLRDGMIRQIRDSATEIRDTGVLGGHSKPKRLMITRAESHHGWPIENTNRTIWVHRASEHFQIIVDEWRRDKTHRKRT